MTEYVPLGELVEVLDHKRIPISAAIRQKRLGNVPYYGATGQVGTIDEALFDEELLLLGEDGVQFFDPSKTKAYRIVGPSWVNNHAHVLRPDPHKALLPYLLHFLNNFDYRGYANGTTRLKLTKSAMCSIPIPTPPIEQQHEIVERIDAALATIFVVESQIRSRKASLNALWASMLHQKLISKNAGEVTTLGAIAKVSMGQSPPGSTYNKTGAGVPFFQGKAEFGDVSPSVRQWTTAGKKFAKPGEILMSVRAPVGPTNIADQYCAIGRGLAAISVMDGADIGYIKWYLKMIEVELASRGKGTTFDAISGDELRDTQLRLPNFEEQQVLSEDFSNAWSRINELQDTLDRVLIRSNLLRRALLHKEFLGEPNGK